MNRNIRQNIRAKLPPVSALEEIADVFSRIDDRATMLLFFGEIFTSAEIKDIALRWQLMKMLSEKIPQRRIAERLGISLCKITRGARILKNPDSVSGSFLRLSYSKPKIKEQSK